MKRPSQKTFREKLRAKLKEDFPEPADYHFWRRFRKEGGETPFTIRFWAPAFMLVVVAFLGLSIYHNPEINESMLTLESTRIQETHEDMIQWVLEMDEETEKLFTDVVIDDWFTEDWDYNELL